jgi:hypothetical protein
MKPILIGSAAPAFPAPPKVKEMRKNHTIAASKNFLFIIPLLSAPHVVGFRLVTPELSVRQRSLGPAMGVFFLSFSFLKKDPHGRPFTIL